MHQERTGVGRRRVLAGVATFGLIAGVGLYASQGAQATVVSPQAATAAHPFPTHVTYKVGVMPSASQASRDAAVEKQYNSWKSTYLVHGCASNEYYVSTKGDNDATNGGTVSEAQGYGMNIVPLMAGYDANAQTEFNGLWQLVQDHEDQYGMMQWQLDGKTCNYYSSGTPDGATDGDLDIGYGLILADQQWGGYTAAAKTWLANFYAHNVTSDGHLKCEDDGPTTDTRPSDNMLDHLRAFAVYDTAHNWNKVITRQQALFSEFTAAYSPSAGLLSDFVVSADTTSPKPAPANYQENQPDNIVGYNSIRVPWHMGTDALENGTSTASVAYSIATKESACLKSLSGGNPANVQPHIKLNCANGNISGDTTAEEAGDSVGPSAMAAGDQAWTDAIWGQLATNPFGDTYYGETIKMLVYIVMAGDYWNPAGTTAPSNDFSVSASPASGSVTAGGTATSTISTAVTSGSAESVALTASGGPAGSTVSFSPASVTSGGSSTLSIATASGTAAGTYPVTVTGTAASGSHTTTYTLTVTVPTANDFSVAVSPASGSVTAGGTATSTVSAAVTSGSAQSVALTATGGPAGSTVSFSPTSVTAGSSSTLSVATAAGTAAGTYPITVTGTAASGSHTTTYTLTVTSGGGTCTPAQLLADPGFENGTNAAPWVQTSTIGSNPVNNDTADEPSHSGSWTAWFDGNSQKDTDTLAQTVTIPTGCTATASFWLHINTTENTTTATPDTFTVQILNSSGTVLGTPATFSNLNHNTGYTQHSYSLTAYAGQTVTLKFTGTETDANGGTTSFVIDDTAINTQ